MKTKPSTNIAKSGKLPTRNIKRFKEAEASYDAIMAEIKPFIRKRKISQYSTAGKWKVLSYET